MNLDRKRPYGTIIGHEIGKFEQDGILFRADGALVDALPETRTMPVELVISTDRVESARLFLQNILKNGPLSKAQVFKICSENNQNWDAVKSACVLERVIVYKYASADMWKLPEEENA